MCGALLCLCRETIDNSAPLGYNKHYYYNNSYYLEAAMYSLHHLWMKTYLQMNRKVMEQTAPLGLSPGQPKILECLALHGECEQKTIAEYCEIEPATAGNILTRMEAAGLVIRRNRPGNRRSLYVSLTDRGAELARTLCGIFLSAEAQMTAGLTDEEQATLIRLLEKCVQNGKGNGE